MGTKHIFKNKNGTIPSFKFWSCVSRFVGGDAVSSSLSRICEPAPAFCSDFPGISIASSPDGFPRWLSVKEAACQCRRHRRCGFSPWVGKIPWRRKWQLTPVFLPRKFQGQRSLVGYSHRVAKSQRQLSNWARCSNRDRNIPQVGWVLHSPGTWLLFPLWLGLLCAVFQGKPFLLVPGPKPVPLLSLYIFV